METGMFFVEVVRFDTMEVVKRLGPNPYRQAERVARGVEINLNHDEYFTRIVAQ